jgi:hypothetical protein
MLARITAAVQTAAMQLQALCGMLCVCHQVYLLAAAADAEIHTKQHKYRVPLSSATANSTSVCSTAAIAS